MKNKPMSPENEAMMRDNNCGTSADNKPMFCCPKDSVKVIPEANAIGGKIFTKENISF